MTVSLRIHADEYLAMRRSLGFKLTTFGTTLMSFIGYLEMCQAPAITTELAVAWAKATPRSVSEIRWARKMMVARIFARHMQVFDPATEVPADDILSHHYCRVSPHLYTPEEVVALLMATDSLQPELRRHSYATLLGLLSVTGLRTGEACRLDDADIDAARGMLLIRDSKFGKSRDVPIHETTLDALEKYAHERDRLRTTNTTTAFFISGRGTRLDPTNLSSAFDWLREQADIHTLPGARAVRLLDFRHTFATSTLLDWYRAGEDVQARLPLLSAYLGHADPKSTYWYLSGAPELMELAANRISGLIGGANYE